jgi:hypothetical protein
MEEFTTYTDRVLHSTPTIMGLKLLTLTLGHVMLLKSMRSRFISGGIAGLAIQDLITEFVLALFVCSTTYDDFLKEVETDKLSVNLNKYVKSLVSEVKTSNDFCLFLKVRQFVNYIQAGTSGPLYEVKNNNGGNDITDNPLESEEIIKNTLMTECGYTRNECLNLPLTEVLSDYLVWQYKQENIDLISKDVYDIIQSMKGKK